MGSKARTPGPLNEAVANEIRAERARRRLTQEQVIERSRVPRSTYVRLEAGTRNIDMEQLHAIARALGVAARDLMERAERHVGAD